MADETPRSNESPRQVTLDQRPAGSSGRGWSFHAKRAAFTYPACPLSPDFVASFLSARFGCSSPSLTTDLLGLTFYVDAARDAGINADCLTFPSPRAKLIEKFFFVQEEHEAEGLHLHGALWFRAKQRITNVRKFDVVLPVSLFRHIVGFADGDPLPYVKCKTLSGIKVGPGDGETLWTLLPPEEQLVFHPNWGPIQKESEYIRYCTKGYLKKVESPTGLLECKKRKQNSYMQLAHQAIWIDKRSFDDMRRSEGTFPICLRYAKTVASWIQERDAELEVPQEEWTLPLVPSEGASQRTLTIVNWLIANIKQSRTFKQKQLWITAPTNFGKTSLRNYLMTRLRTCLCPYDGKFCAWWDNYSDEHDLVVFDEFGPGKFDFQRMKLFLEGTCPISKRGQPSYLKTKPLPVIILSNLPPEKCYPNVSMMGHLDQLVPSRCYYVHYPRDCDDRVFDVLKCFPGYTPPVIPDVDPITGDRQGELPHLQFDGASSTSQTATYLEDP